MFFDALGSLPLGGIPVHLPIPAPPPSGGVATGGGFSFGEDIHWQREPVREKKHITDEEMAILLAAYREYYM